MQLIKRIGIIALAGVGLGFGTDLAFHKIRPPKPVIKAPTTRYHGYNINAAAINKVRSYTVLISNEGFGGGKPWHRRPY